MRSMDGWDGFVEEPTDESISADTDLGPDPSDPGASSESVIEVDGSCVELELFAEVVVLLANRGGCRFGLWEAAFDDVLEDDREWESPVTPPRRIMVPVHDMERREGDDVQLISRIISRESGERVGGGDEFWWRWMCC